MGRPMSPFVALGSTAVLIIAMASSSAAQSPSAGPSGSPAASTAVPGGSPMGTAVGPITWQQVTKGKDFTSGPAVYQVGQRPDGQLMVVGSVGGATGQPSGAAWTSPDGAKWSRVKLKAPKGSSITAIEDLGTTVVATGDAGDGTGLLWTSSDGTTWKVGEHLRGVIYDLAATPSGLVGTGAQDGAATVWLSPDGARWQPQNLAPSGYALHVAAGPDGALVVAGVVTDTAGDRTPTVWSSTDGVAWTQTTVGELVPGRWSVPAMALTPAGYVLALTELAEGGAIGHIWSSPDGVSWTETLVDDSGPLGVVGTAGTDALVIGHGQVLRSPDAVTWTSTDEPSFQGWSVRDLMTLADGRLFAAGDAQDPTGSSMAMWVGEAAPAP